MKRAWGRLNASTAALLALYGNARALRMTALGFSSGLPLLLVFGTLSFWLREAGVSIQTIGFMSWIGLIYAMKWLWAPVIDRCPIPVLTRALGRRRAWMLAAQLGLMASLIGLALSDPAVSLSATAALAMCTAFSSATQDIALDAYRIESASADEQAALAALYQTGYRIAMIWAGAGALAIAAWAEPAGHTGYVAAGWRVSYFVMAASVGLGVLATLFSPEARRAAPVEAAPKKTLREKLDESVIEPFSDFFKRYGWLSLAVLGVVATYRISDVVMGVMANPFYADMGFSKDEVAAITKVFGVVMTLVGAFAGGTVTQRIGVVRALILGGILSAATNLLFALLAERGHDTAMLIAAVSADNLASGLATAAFVAFLSGLTSREFSATQYALLSSLMLLFPKFLAGFSGVAVSSVGYAGFFVATAAIGIPVVILLFWLRKRLPSL